MALVFLGISLQEVGPTDQAPLAFNKAIELKPCELLAWNGLLNFYEKSSGSENVKELIKIYLKLMEIDT